MKILHTSDWHLGRTLYGRKRYEEFSAFLDWLTQTIDDEKVDALLVAGDVFDTSTPSNRAQELYYRFLCRVASSCCRHVVVVAGNHDSPSFLNAPKELLRALNVYVVGSITEALEDEVFVLCTDDTPEAIVCAVPYLRDKDIRTVEPGENIDDKNAKLVEGLKSHYAEVCAIAEQKRSVFNSAGYEDIPIIAMGHLFTAGGKTVDGDGVRELYVGSLAHIGVEVFPSAIDYLALGHLHVPQAVGNAEHIRYCGSPIPMGYGEATQIKKVVLIEFSSTTPKIQELPVPCFQELVRIVGSLDDIHAKLEELKKKESSAWIEIEYIGSDIIGNLREMLDESMNDSAMEIRRIKNRRIMDSVISAVTDDETLDDLDAGDVFIRCLDVFDVPDKDREELTVSYNEIIKSLHEEDANAE
ncbi:exonuclease SbcCD subunit D C-terminal domain-containing protein [Desulfovibrio desulfuricans]|uniref:exonuclease SbcCD subunit D C-terminal domain-containing protein n=1 Tax=Desulfovibrio desulfuricans TaxID=876 RepID=UPI0017817860|nr:exonuclease SbcCD subunit D C-terminal domain-containing protein [Desulfovibrio desulfuricans]MBD8894385.1 exonuclease SbcCD subunit D C-terminal domain-containing protein [Desulfovibrio desulfuricans]